MNGFHNLDLGQNINLLNAKQGLSLIDINSQGETWTGTETRHANLKCQTGTSSFKVTICDLTHQSTEFKTTNNEGVTT